MKPYRHAVLAGVGLLLLASLFWSGCSTTSPAERSARRVAAMPGQMLGFSEEEAASSAGLPEKDEPAPSRGLVKSLLWYVPNRLLDLMDIFRARAHVGPGLAFGIRITDHVNIFGGSYNTVYAGLPGPRMGPELRPFVGREQERGLMFMGVDATDDFEREPNYSPSTFHVGAQVLLLGLELGFDVVELADFLAGIFGMDFMGDDR